MLPPCLFGAETVLTLAPRWGSSLDLLDWGPWALLGLVPLSLIVWLYRYELKLVGGVASGLLLALRFTVLVLLLFLVFWQPRLEARSTEKVANHVLVLLDRTGSMDVKDPSRTALEKLHLARALKLWPDLDSKKKEDFTSEKELERWIADLTEKENKLEPQWPSGEEKARRRRFQLVCEHVNRLTKTRTSRTPLGKIKAARARKLWLDVAAEKNEDVSTEKELDGWILELNEKMKKVEPKWLSDEEIVNSSPTARQQLEKEARQRFQLLCDHVDRLTRTHLVKRLLEEGRGNFLADLGGRFQVQIVTFAQEPIAVAPKKLLAELDAKDKATVKPPSSESDFTDFKPVLDTALKQVTESGGTIRGVVFITDGRQQDRYAKPLLEANQAKQLREQNAPIYPIVVGSREVRPATSSTILVSNMEAPTTLLKDPEDAKNLNAVIKAKVHVTAIQTKNLVVELLDGTKLIGRRTLNLDPAKTIYSVEFPTALSEEGTHELKIRVVPPDSYKEKTGLEKSAKTQVINDQAQVLVIDGEARWEYHYLTVALGRDRIVKEVRGVVFEQPRIDKVQESELKQLNWPALKLPDDKAGLTGYDCIVLGDVPPERLPLADRKRLQSYVRDTGGTLVIVAGKRAMPLGYPKEDPKKEIPTDPITALLPIFEPHIVKSKDGFRVTLTSEGEKNQLLQLSDKATEEEPGADTKLPRQIWSELPPHYWAVVGEKKPAAKTLAYYPGEPGAKEMTEAEQEAQSLIAWHSYGNGRVLFVGLDSTWRWRYKVGDQHHHRFWGQLVRWATADKLLPGGAGKVRFGTPRPDYKVGEEIDVRLRLDHSLPEPGAEASIVANILRVEGKTSEKVASVLLKPRKAETDKPDEKKPGQKDDEPLPEGNPRLLAAKLRDLPPGSYKIELGFGDLEKKYATEVDLIAVNKQAAEFTIDGPLNDEMANVTPDEELLKNLANDSGSGQEVYTLDTAHEIVDKLERKEDAVKEGKPTALWEWWPTLLLILGLLTVEWVGRKWAGLP